MLTEAALDSYARHTKRRLAYARYKVAGIWRKAEIDRCEYPAGEPGRLNVWLVLEPPVSNGVDAVSIEGVQLIDTAGEIFLETKEAILMDARQEGVLYRISFEFKEHMESEVV